jgi:hypothetical protein
MGVGFFLFFLFFHGGVETGSTVILQKKNSQSRGGACLENGIVSTYYVRMYKVDYGDIPSW